MSPIFTSLANIHDSETKNIYIAPDTISLIEDEGNHRVIATMDPDITDVIITDSLEEAVYKIKEELKEIRSIYITLSEAE